MEFALIALLLGFYWLEQKRQSRWEIQQKEARDRDRSREERMFKNLTSESVRRDKVIQQIIEAHKPQVPDFNPQPDIAQELIRAEIAVRTEEMRGGVSPETGYEDVDLSLDDRIGVR